MTLSAYEAELLTWHRSRLAKTRRQDKENLDVYNGDNLTEQIGIAVPRELEEYAGNLNYCRRLIELKADRQQVRRFTLPGEDQADPILRRIMDASNFGAQFAMFNTDRMVYGRGVMSVHVSATGLPLFRAESPTQMDVAIDELTEEPSSAARFLKRARRPGQDRDENVGVLYLPDETVVAVEGRGGRWEELSRQTHNLGRVPVVVYFNRRVTGKWEGEAEFKDLLPIQVAANRAFLSLQLVQEAHGWPGKWVAVKSAEKLTTGPDGEPRSKLEAYVDSLMLLSDPEAKVGQFAAADLSNFQAAFEEYDHKASVVSGLPARYFQKNTQNPATEGAIIADEINLVRDVESDNEQLGIVLGRLAAIAYQVETGDALDAPVAVDWFNPATPTLAQRADALSKQVAAGALSREGFWDELGWTEARKAKERANMAAEARMADPLFAHFGGRVIENPFTSLVGVANDARADRVPQAVL